MNEYRFHLNRIPEVAENRLAVANIYRKLRRDGEANIGRLLWKRDKAATTLLRKHLEDSIYTHGTGGSDGLRGLFGPD